VVFFEILPPPHPQEMAVSVAAAIHE